MRIGLIGAGKFGSMYLAQIPRTPGVHLVGIADLSPDGARAPTWRAWAGSRSARSAASLDEALQARQHARRRRLAGAGAPPGDRRHRRMHRPPDRRGRPLPGGLCATASTSSTSPSRPTPSAARCWRASARRGRRDLFAGLRRPAGADLRPGRLGAHLRLPGGGGRARPQVAAALQRNRRPRRCGATTA